MDKNLLRWFISCDLFWKAGSSPPSYRACCDWEQLHAQIGPGQGLLCHICQSSPDNWIYNPWCFQQWAVSQLPIGVWHSGGSVTQGLGSSSSHLPFPYCLLQKKLLHHQLPWQVQHYLDDHDGICYKDLYSLWERDLLYNCLLNNPLVVLLFFHLHGNCILKLGHPRLSSFLQRTYQTSFSSKDPHHYNETRTRPTASMPFSTNHFLFIHPLPFLLDPQRGFEGTYKKGQTCH